MRVIFKTCVDRSICSNFQIVFTYDSPSSGPYKKSIHDPHLTGQLLFLLWTCAAVSREAEDITQLWCKSN